MLVPLNTVQYTSFLRQEYIIDIDKPWLSA